ncbi:hypothetical protein L1887_42120 [Cichorium endivia]|nr:hypothetical protein L1887_42120 [Cichorium endivia]
MLATLLQWLASWRRGKGMSQHIRMACIFSRMMHPCSSCPMERSGPHHSLISQHPHLAAPSSRSRPRCITKQRRVRNRRAQETSSGATWLQGRLPLAEASESGNGRALQGSMDAGSQPDSSAGWGRKACRQFRPRLAPLLLARRACAWALLRRCASGAVPRCRVQTKSHGFVRHHSAGLTKSTRTPPHGLHHQPSAHTGSAPFGLHHHPPLPARTGAHHGDTHYRHGWSFGSGTRGAQDAACVARPALTVQSHAVGARSHRQPRRPGARSTRGTVPHRQPRIVHTGSADQASGSCFALVRTTSSVGTAAPTGRLGRGNRHPAPQRRRCKVKPRNRRRHGQSLRHCGVSDRRDGGCEWQGGGDGVRESCCTSRVGLDARTDHSKECPKRSTYTHRLYRQRTASQPQGYRRSGQLLCSIVNG